jgi:hypothetical protein
VVVVCVCVRLCLAVPRRSRLGRLREEEELGLGERATWVLGWTSQADVRAAAVCLSLCLGKPPFFSREFS